MLIILSGCNSGDGSSQSYNYKKAGHLIGQITAVGSNTMNNLMSLWCEGFTDYYPEVSCSIEGVGSEYAPPALISKHCEFGMMSDKMLETDFDKFKRAYGYEPTAIITSIDTVAVYVNSENPLSCITIPQVDSIFSDTYKCPGSGDIKEWGELGLTGTWKNKKIEVLGREAKSGTQRFFKDVALCQGKYKDSIISVKTSSALVDKIGNEKYAIGYSGIGFRTSHVKTLEVGSSTNKCYSPNARSAVRGEYPLARYLYLYVNKSPQEGLDNLEEEFLKYILSRQGQKKVVEAGYDKLPLNIISQQLKKIRKPK